MLLNIAFELMLITCLSRDDEDDSLSKMKAAEGALEAKEKVILASFAKIALFHTLFLIGDLLYSRKKIQNFYLQILCVPSFHHV